MNPPFTITTRREPHTHYVRHAIVLANGRVIHEQLSPYGPGEPETRIREYLTPPPLRPLPPFNYGRAKGGRPKRGQGADTPFNEYGEDQ